MNILILTDHFSRPSYLSRLRFLCDYLTDQEHHVEVFTEKWETISFEHRYPIHELAFYHIGYISWAIKTVYSMFTNSKDRSFARRVSRKTRKSRFDLVMCTTSSTFPLTAAYKIAKKRGIKLYVDIRELEELVPAKEYTTSGKIFVKPWANLYSWIQKNRRNRVIRHADLVTTVSPWHMDILKAMNPNTHLMYNGYDPEFSYTSKTKTENFQINYIGRTYDTQDPSLMLKAVRELNLPNVEINFYSNMGTYDRVQQKGVQIFGFLPSNAIAGTMRRSSIVVILTNSAKNGAKEMKLFDAIGCEKPVLCVPNDEGMLAHVIQLANAGICTSDLQEAKDFIQTQYDIWKRQGYTHQDVTNKELFDRQHQAKILEDLLRHIVGV